MRSKVPAWVSPDSFLEFIKECAALVGQQNIVIDDQDINAYRDAYRMTGDVNHIPAAAVIVNTRDEVMAIVKLANTLKVPLWPISRGKNLAYGGSAPQMSGSVILDMSRMNKIIEVNEELGYIKLEPGVGFFDLENYLRENHIKLWASYPEQCWGSVIGNAMDRGVGRTPYGDHSANFCGLEVVLPTGELLKTGMEAMTASKSGPVYKHGFGPGYDQLFVQSNFGIVTSATVWLMPQPKSTITLRLGAPDEDDLGWMMETLITLCKEGIIDQYFTLINFMPIVAMYTTREKWFEKGKPMTQAQIHQMLKAMKLGWWNAEVTFYGNQSVIEAKEAELRAAFSAYPKLHIERFFWTDDMPLSKSGKSNPTTNSFQLINWYGGRGGHIDFSPVLPSIASEILAYYYETKKLVEQYGQDFHCALHVKQRHCVCINALRFDRDDPGMTSNVTKLFKQLLEDAKQRGYGEYRTHLDWMDEVASTYDFNDGALLKLSKTIKDALDPNGILAPGKSGIWPSSLDEQKGESQ